MKSVPEIGLSEKSFGHGFEGCVPRQRKAAPSIQQRLEMAVATAGSSAIPVSRTLAMMLIDQCGFDGQRTIRSGRKELHVRRIRNGSWNPDVSVIHIARLAPGDLRVVNGYHRLAAIADSSDPVMSRFVIIDVDDISDVKRLYAMFDDPMSTRSDGEVLDGAGVSEALGLGRMMAVAAFRAVTLLENDLEAIAHHSHHRLSAIRDRESRIEAMADWAPEFREMQRISMLASSGIGRSLRTSAALASAAYTLRHQPVIAKEFWQGLAENDGLRRNDPRSRLIIEFSESAANKGSIRRGVQRIAVAWNAFYEGRDLTIIRCSEGGKIVFKGTPKKG